MSASGVGEVLATGWRLFTAGLSTVFPWVLAAELTQMLPFANTRGLFDTDLSLFGQPAFLAKALVCGTLQAFFYSVAVLRLAGLSGETPRHLVQGALRATLAVLVAYIVYELLVVLGLLIALLFFIIGVMIAGWLAGLVLCCLPMAPTAAASTALAFFIFPAVLEQRGPIAALGESLRLAKRSWVRVSLVISVPAVVLLLQWCVDNGAEVHKNASNLLALMSHAEDASSMDDLQSLLSSTAPAAVTSTAYAWKLTQTVLGAFCWWYTLAICYAQYRDLKTRAP